MEIKNTERQKRLKSRNVALGLALLGFVILFYIVTLAKGVPLISRIQ